MSKRKKEYATDVLKREIEERKKKLKPCPFCNGKAILEKSKFGLNVIHCESCEARITAFYMGDAIKAWNTRNYLEKQDSSKELMEFVKFCRNASAKDIRKIHDRARDLIAEHKECCEKSCKEENATLKPLIPKWSKYSDETLVLNVNVMQCAYIEFNITNEENKYRLTAFLKANGRYCNEEDGGFFNTLEKAKEKANDYIKWIGEMLVCYSDKIRTTDELES